MLIAIGLAMAVIGAEMQTVAVDDAAVSAADVAPVRARSEGTLIAPYDRLPRVTPITDAESTGPAGSSDKSCSHYVVFDRPAAFEVIPTPACSGRGTTDTAVIYEGMAVRFGCDGQYTTRLVVETPATSVTLRMQFVVYRQRTDTDDESDEKCHAYERLGTITLPPMRLEAASQSVGEERPRIWKIEHSGYSHLLESKHCKKLALDRIGAAEFGAVPTR